MALGQWRACNIWNDQRQLAHHWRSKSGADNARQCSDLGPTTNISTCYHHWLGQAYLLTLVGGCSMFIVARSIVEIVCWQLLLRATPCHPSRHPPLQHWIESVLSLQVFRSFKCFTPRPASENRRNNIWALDKLLVTECHSQCFKC